MNFMTKSWIATKKTKQFGLSSEFKKKVKYVKGSVFAILSGFIVAGVIVSILNVNPFVYFGKMFEVAFTDLYSAKTLNWAAIYIVAGIAVAIGFKSGVFNIGLPGQILGASGVSTVVVWSILDPTATEMSGGLIFLVFLLCVVVAAFLAFIAGILKALFNIHEVVTTILLNWAVWYLFKYVFMTYGEKFGSSLAGASKAIPEHMLDIGTNEWILPLIIAGICVAVVGILFAKTTFGFKLRAVGSSPNASKYAGINVKNKIVSAMVLSGAFAGVAGFLNVMTVDPNTFFGSDSLPTLGFDAIAVSLVAFNNPVGMLFVGMLWGVIKNAGEPISSLFGIPTQISGLVTGIIIYLAAIAVIFMYFKPWDIIKNQIYLFKSNQEAKLLRILNWEKLKLIFVKTFPIFNKEYKEGISKLDLRADKKDFKENFKAIVTMRVNHINNEIKELRKLIVDINVNKGIGGIKSRKRNELLVLDRETLKVIDEAKLDYNVFKAENGMRKYDILNYKKMQMVEIKKRYKKDLKAAKIWKDTELGSLTLRFDYINGKIEINGNKEKLINAINERIITLRGDISLGINVIKMDETISIETKAKRIAELKQTNNEEIRNLKAEKFSLKTDAIQKVAKLKEKHVIYKTRVKNEKVQLQQVNENTNNMIVEAKDAFLLRKSKLNDQVEYNKTLIDIKRSEKIINDVERVLEVLENEISSFASAIKVNESVIKNYDEIIKRTEAAKVKIDEILTPATFEEFDEPFAIKKRLSLALKIRRLIIEWISNREAYLNKTKHKEINSINENILSESKLMYKQYSNKLKTEIMQLKGSNKIKNNKEFIGEVLMVQNSFYENIEKQIGLITNAQMKLSEGVL